MEKNVSKVIAKKNAVKELNSILKSPFAVMNLINKNRDSENIKNLMDIYGIDKIELSMLLHVTTGGAPVFCKLQKISDIDFLDGNELKVIQIGKNFYEFVAIKFSVSAFFQSLESAMKVAAEAEKQKKQAEKSKAKREKRSAVNSAKRIANRAAKVAAKAKELKEKFADLPDNMIMQLAEEFFKAA